MEEDVLNALQTRTVYLPGGFDRNGKVIFIVNIVNDLQSWQRKCLELSVTYLKRSLSDLILQKGLTIIVDAQKDTARISRQHARFIYGLFRGLNITLYLVKSEGFWEKHVETCTKSYTKEEPIILSKARLTKFFDMHNLPEELGGSLQFNYDLWLQQHEFEKCYNNTLTAMENLQLLLQSSKSTLRPTEADAELKKCAQVQATVHNSIEATMDLGNRILTRFNEIYAPTPPLTSAIIAPTAITHLTSNELATNLTASTQVRALMKRNLPLDLNCERSRIELRLNDIEKRQTELRNLWLELMQIVREGRELSSLEEGVAFVTNWILNTAEQLLNRQHTIGCDVKACEQLRTAHNVLEMECRETYGFYGELLYKIDTYNGCKDGLAYRDLISQRDFMQFVCRSFASRLERRRNMLITSLRFYRLVNEYFERTTQVFESLVMDNKMEDFTKAAASLKKLKDSQQSLVSIERELIKEGEKLSDMLSMPVKDALGRDLHIDYSDDICNVREILETTLARRKIFSDSVELQKLTLEQVTHIQAYEEDSRMAIKWLDDLYNVMIRCHTHVGCNIYEIQVQKDELQTFQKTGKSIYNYGCQLLEASQALRGTCKLSLSDAVQMQEELQHTWHSLQSISQEHMTRLRVSAVFHRSSADVLPDHSKMLNEQRDQLRKHLIEREQLLLEVGRMVRLGRLLKTRLKEPFILDAATGKRSKTPLETLPEVENEAIPINYEIESEAQLEGLNLLKSLVKEENQVNEASDKERQSFFVREQNVKMAHPSQYRYHKALSKEDNAELQTELRAQSLVLDNNTEISQYENKRYNKFFTDSTQDEVREQVSAISSYFSETDPTEDLSKIPKTENVEDSLKIEEVMATRQESRLKPLTQDKPYLDMDCNDIFKANLNLLRDRECVDQLQTIDCKNSVKNATKNLEIPSDLLSSRFHENENKCEKTDNSLSDIVLKEQLNDLKDNNETEIDDKEIPLETSQTVMYGFDSVAALQLPIKSGIIIEDLPSEMSTSSPIVDSVSASSSSGCSSSGSISNSSVDASKVVIKPIANNSLACNAISAKLTEIAEVAESLDTVIRDIQDNALCMELESSDGSADKKVGTPRSNSSEDWHSRSTEDDSFVTASEGNFTPFSQSSSSYRTASGRTTSSFVSCDKNSFDADDATFVYEMPELTSPLNTSFESSEQSYVSAQNRQTQTTIRLSKEKSEKSAITFTDNSSQTLNELSDKQEVTVNAIELDEQNIIAINENLRSESITPTLEQRKEIDNLLENASIESEAELEISAIADAPSMAALGEIRPLTSVTPEVSLCSIHSSVVDEPHVQIQQQRSNKPNANWRRIYHETLKNSFKKNYKKIKTLNLKLSLN
uniref:SESTD1-like spectrin repeats region domain-containing protein n=1 Tax=Glossina pallidipes TaxID=7398 RepID=A0A1B0AEX1_GLOPL